MALPPPPTRPLSIDEAHAALTAVGMILETTEAVVDGVTFKVWKNAFPTVRALWENTARFRDLGWDYLLHVSPDGTEQQRVSFAEAWNIVSTLGHTFLGSHAAFGLGKGSRVAILSRNRPEFVTAFYGIVSSGNIAVPVNAWLKGEEYHYCIDNADCRVLIVDEERLARLIGDRHEENYLIPLQRKGLTVIVVPDSKPSEAQRRDWQSKGILLGRTSSREASSAAGGAPFRTLRCCPKTTQPLCTRSHRNFTSCPFHNNVAPLRSYLRRGEPIPTPDPNAPQQIGLVTLPMFHVGGLHGAVQAYTTAGALMITINKFDAGLVVRCIERYRITGIGTVPTIVWAIIEHPEFTTRDMSSLASFVYGGSPASEDLQKRVRDKVKGSQAGMSFGITETGSNNVTSFGDDFVLKPMSTGVPTPVNKIMVIDPEDDKEFKPLPVNTVGEVCIFGPNVVRGGYWRNPEATKKAFFKPGWYRTGDLGRIDEEGSLFIVDRAKDMLIRGGENVYCAVVENALFQHPSGAVIEAAVVGLPHKRLGEEVAAVVQIKPEFEGKITERDLRQWAASKLASFQVPVMIDIRTTELPYNAARKVLKRELRDEVVKIARERGLLDGGASKL
ncbi:hypothetical protein DFJ74DRAFT_758226 [Hyaloraphidium curvatum]|nr:hypothetical protein DFJ74DRAFT_758226 [Hyaloraphidium curvatum]